MRRTVAAARLVLAEARFIMTPARVAATAAAFAVTGASRLRSGLRRMPASDRRATCGRSRATLRIDRLRSTRRSEPPPHRRMACAMGGPSRSPSLGVFAAWRRGLRRRLDPRCPVGVAVIARAPPSPSRSSNHGIRRPRPRPCDGSPSGAGASRRPSRPCRWAPRTRSRRCLPGLARRRNAHAAAGREPRRGARPRRFRRRPSIAAIPAAKSA